MLNQKTQIIRILEKKCQDEINDTLQKSSFNDKLPWTLTRKHKEKQAKVIPSVSQEKELISHPTEKIEVLHSSG